MHTVTIELRNVLGRESALPVCAYSKALCAMTGRRTLSAADLRSIRALGFRIVTQDNRTQSQLLAAIIG